MARHISRGKRAVTARRDGGSAIEILLDEDLLGLRLRGGVNRGFTVFLIDGFLEDGIGPFVFTIDGEEFLATEEVRDHDDELDDEVDRAESPDDDHAHRDEGEEQGPEYS